MWFAVYSVRYSVRIEDPISSGCLEKMRRPNTNLTIFSFSIGIGLIYELKLFQNIKFARY